MLVVSSVASFLANAENNFVINRKKIILFWAKKHLKGANLREFCRKAYILCRNYFCRIDKFGEDNL